MIITDVTTFDHHCAVCGNIRRGLAHEEARLIVNRLSEEDVVQVLVISCPNCDSHESLNMRLTGEDEHSGTQTHQHQARHIRRLLQAKGLQVTP